MILDHLEHADQYLPLHLHFRDAFTFLQNTQLAKLPDGRTEIEGDAVYAMVVREDGRGQAGARLESHQRTIDIQYAVSGEEVIGWSPAGTAHPGEGYDAEKDVDLHEGTPLAWLPTPPGAFAVFFPQDLHAPLAGSGPLVKVVVKVRL